MVKRRHFSTYFKAKVALSTIRGDGTMVRITTDDALFTPSGLTG
jgi:hypothetical protein